MAAVKRLRGLDDGGCWTIPTLKPVLCHDGRARCGARDLRDHVGQSSRRHTQWASQAVVVPLKRLILASSSLCSDQNWHDGQGMAGFVKVLQIEPIAIGLIKTRSLEVPCTDLVLHHENHAAKQHDKVSAAPHARD